MRKLKQAALAILAVAAVLGIGGWIFMSTAVFGAYPAQQRLERVKASPNYRDGAFQNLEPTPEILPNVSYTKMTWNFLFGRPKRNEPGKPIPTIHTDLKALPHAKPTLVWFGHSSYLIKSDFGTILMDPVFSGAASPVPITGKAFKGADVYGVDDMPDIDVLVISHDHYDHLDYKTIEKIHPKVKRFVTALGVGAHLERFGVPAEKITELDWWEGVRVSDSLKLTSTPARHFSGRSFKRGQTLWSSFVLELGPYKLFLGGDSGYDKTFQSIGEKFGPFDLAMLECGQYGVNWPYIHMTPEQTAQAALDLNTRVLMPVHWGKFALALHDWDEPIQRVTAEAARKHLRLTTPTIGQPVVVGEVYPDGKWWEAIQ